MGYTKKTSPALLLHSLWSVQTNQPDLGQLDQGLDHQIDLTFDDINLGLNNGRADFKIALNAEI